uniref:Uncharacterized protein n=1 Tax=Arundo donax TaxID=35708 RepID=A0A0A8ZKC6_ARUDO
MVPVKEQTDCIPSILSSMLPTKNLIVRAPPAISRLWVNFYKIFIYANRGPSISLINKKLVCLLSVAVKHWLCLEVGMSLVVSSSLPVLCVFPPFLYL